MDRKELENGMNELEALDGDDARVAELLSTLARVEAPANFEFGLKAKIASANDSAPRSSLIPFVKVSAPLALLLVVGAFAIFYATLPGGGDNMVENPTSPKPEVVQPSAETRVSEVRSGPRIEQPVEPQPEPTLAQSNRVLPPRRRNTNRSTQGGSLDQPMTTDHGFKAAPVINPRGFGSDAVPLPDVLGILGINAEFVEGAWKARSVTESSAGERSGVRANDILEAIDNQVLTEKTTFKGPFSPKTLRVRRDTKSIELTLGN